MDQATKTAGNRSQTNSLTGDSGMPPFVESVLNNGMYEVEQNLSSLMYEHIQHHRETWDMFTLVNQW